MAAAIYPHEPGSKYGPCEGSKDCKHLDCAEQRADATSECRVCHKQIGYGNRTYIENVGKVGEKRVLVHADCLEDEVEHNRANAELKPLAVTPVPIKQWGRDHWTTLAYLEERCVNHGGEIPRDDKRMRNKNGRGKLYPTRLLDGSTLEGHDDYDCLEDIIAAGLAERYQSSPNEYRLTDKGWRVAGIVRHEYYAEGNSKDFTWYDDYLERLMDELLVRYADFKSAKETAEKDSNIDTQAILTMAAHDYMVVQMSYAKRAMDVRTGEWIKRVNEMEKVNE